MRGSFDFGDNPFPISEETRGFGRVTSRYDANVVDEAFLSGDSTATASALSQPAYVGLTLSAKKLRAAFGVIAALLGGVLLRAGHVQIARGAEFRAIAEGNRVREVPIPVERGVMYDRTGMPLVRNVPKFSATVTPADLPKDDAERRVTLNRLALILGVTVEDVEKAIAEFKGYEGSPVTVADNLTHEQAVRLEIEAVHSQGVALATGLRRDYVATGAAPSLSHVLGYQGRLTKEDLDKMTGGDYQPSDSAGKMGLEKQYEAVLRGTYGERRVEVDAVGHQKKVIAEETGSQGKNLVLTIDMALQKKAEEFLREQLTLANKTRASVIVMNPNNGDVLALVSVPAFDSNAFAKGISSDDYAALLADKDNPMFPRAIAGALASGSVFKPVVAAAALDEGIVTEHTSFLSSGGIRIGAWFFPDWRAGGHGTTNVTKALADSVNTFFYYVGGGVGDFRGLGMEKIIEYARKFGYGSVLGIDLPGETAGFLPSIEWKESRGEKWYVGDTYHIAIGQGDVIVTPLQVATMTAAVANRGTLVKPRLVSAVTTADGTREPRAPEVLATNVASRSSLDIVRKGMRQTVTAGSARSLGSLSVAVAGKTGTAQWNSTKDNHAWFTSFAPYDKPEIVVTVMIEEGVEGSRNATPVARKIYDWYFNERRKTAAEREAEAAAAAAAAAAARAQAEAEAVVPVPPTESQ